MSGATGLLERCDFVVQGLPASAKNMSSGDDNVNFMGARFDGSANLCHTFSERRKSCRKSRGDGGHVYAASLQCRQRGLDERVINAYGRNLHSELLDAKFPHQIRLDRLPRFCTQTPYAFVRVIAGERRQVHARNRPQKPRRLPFFLDRSPCHLRLRAALHGAGVHAHFLYPVQIEWNPGVRKQRPLSKHGNRVRGLCFPRHDFASASPFVISRHFGKPEV